LRSLSLIVEFSGSGSLFFVSGLILLALDHPNKEFNILSKNPSFFCDGALKFTYHQSWIVCE